jgi:hypothetical protein
LQDKYDNQSEEVSILPSKLQQWDAYSAQEIKLQDEMTAELYELYRREYTYARLLTFLKARDYRFGQSTSMEDNGKYVQGITMALEKRWYGDVIWWINYGLTPNSIISRLTEENACTAAIQSETRIMRTVLDEPAPRTEARATHQELITKLRNHARTRSHRQLTHPYIPYPSRQDDYQL